MSGPNPDLLAAVVARLEADGAKRHGQELRARCPSPDHEDRNPSFDFNTVLGVGKCTSCPFTCSTRQLADLLGLDDSSARSNGSRTQQAPATPKAADPPAAPLPTAEKLEAFRLQLCDHEAGAPAREYLARYGIDPAACGWGAASCSDPRKFGLPPAAEGIRLVIPVYDLNGELQDVRRYAGPWPCEEASAKMLPWAAGHGAARPYRWTGELAADVAAAVVWCEGEKDCEALRAAGFVAVSNTNGASSAAKVARELPGEVLAGRQVVTLFDHDAPGRKESARLADVLAARGAVAAVASWPDTLRDGTPTPEGFDAADWFAAGYGADALRELLAQARPVAASSSTTVDTSPDRARAGDGAAVGEVDGYAVLAELQERLRAAGEYGSETTPAAVLREAATDPETRAALAALAAGDPATLAAVVSELREAAPAADRPLVTALDKSAKADARQQREEAKQRARQAAAEHRAQRQESAGAAATALAEFLRGEYEPLFRTLDPATLTLWDRQHRATFTLPYARQRARDEFQAATGSVLSALLDRLAPLPATEQQPAPTWRGSRGAEEALSDALTTLGAEVPHRESLRELGRGVHLVPDGEAQRVVVVNGATPLWHDGAGWRETDLPVCPLGLVNHARHEQAAPWLPGLSAEFLATAPARSLADCLALLAQAIDSAWCFAEDHASDLLALYTVYGIAAYAWRRRVYLHICGPSSTGKSAFRDLWIAHFWPHWTKAEDVSEAGLASAYGNTAAPLVIDEFEQTERENPHLHRILVAARRSTYGDSEKLRGTIDGGSRSFRFSWPLVILSTEPLATAEQDANRFLTLNTRVDPGRQSDRALADFWRAKDVDPAELRADLWRHALTLAPEFADTMPRMGELAPAPAGIDHRYAEAAHVLLTVAEVAATGAGAGMMETIGPALTERARATRAMSPQESLVSLLLARRWRCDNHDMTGDLVLAEVNSGRAEADEYGIYGFVVERPPGGNGLDPPMDGPELWVSLQAAQQSALSRTPFEDCKVQTLQQYLSRHPAYRGSTPGLWRRGGARARWQRLDIATLAGGDDHE